MSRVDEEQAADEPGGAARRRARVVLRDAVHARASSASGWEPEEHARLVRGHVRGRDRGSPSRALTARVTVAGLTDEKIYEIAAAGEDHVPDLAGARRRSRSRSTCPTSCSQPTRTRTQRATRASRAGEAPRHRANTPQPGRPGARLTWARAMSNFERLIEELERSYQRGPGAACPILRSTTTTARRRRSGGG